MSTGYDTSGYDVEPYDAEAGGLTLLPNAFLDRPSVLWCWDLYLTSSFPISFPWTFDAAPFRVSQLDCYPGGVLGDVLYEKRLLEKPTVSHQATDVFGGLEQIEQVRFRLVATDPASTTPDLHVWMMTEHRGKLLIGHLLELDPQQDFTVVTIHQNAFRGELLALADDPETVSLLARAFDLPSMIDLVPTVRVTTGWAPYAPQTSLGRVVPFGTGIGRRIPCIPVLAETDETILFEHTFTADATTDLLTIIDHELDTGAGPFLVSTTGTLPAGLVPTADYWIVAVDEDSIRLAATQGDALSGVTIDLTSAGTGTHTLRGGLAPNVSPNYDVAVGIGNIGVLRVWEGDAASQGANVSDVPDVPTSYVVQHRTYKPSARYVTSIRFPEAMDGTELSADILRVYPDVDNEVLAEWKFLTSLGDDVGGLTMVSTPGAPETAGTSDLTATHQRYGLGGIALNGQKSLDIVGSTPVLARNTFTFELEFIPATTAVATETGLFSSHNVGSLPVWSLNYNESVQAASVTVFFQDGTTWTASTATGAVPRGRPARITLRRNGTTGQTDLFLGRTLISTDTRSATLATATAETPFRAGVNILQPPRFRGVLGWTRFSSSARPQRYLDAAYWLWKRNGIEFLRELAADSGRIIDTATFDAATTTWDGIAGGTLRCDGWLIEENELRAVLTSMIPFRELAFSIGADTHLEVQLATMPSIVQGRFGYGDEYANVLSRPTRTRASLTEIPRTLAVRFRRPRTGTAGGPFGGYGMEIRRNLLGVGKDIAPLELPFVDDPVTADVIADFRAKRMRTRDQLIDVELGMEARTVMVGDVIRLSVPDMSISDVDLEAIQVAHGDIRTAIRGVPIAAADFVYTPQRLPADPAERTLQVTDLAQYQTLTATIDSDKRVLLMLELSDVTLLRPNGHSPHVQPTTLFFPSVVGAATAWDAVNEAVANDSTYVEQVPATGLNPIELFTFPTFVPSRPDPIVSVTLRCRLKAASTGTATNWYAFWPDVTGGTLPDGALTSGPGLTTNMPTTVTDFSIIFTQHYVLHQPWTVAWINRFEAGIFTGPETVTRTLTQFFLEVRQKRPQPLPGGFLKYWRIGPTATGDPAPLTPAETAAPIFTVPDFAPKTDDLSSAGAGKYWYWAGIFDEFGRRLVTVGPAAVVVP